ncbi:MAG: TetR/AcrR family transcriptional regulator, partial [Enterococcus hulanensis]
YPYEAVEMAMIYANTVFDVQELASSEEMKVQRVNGFFYLLERMLGVEEGLLAKEMEGMFD